MTTFDVASPPSYRPQLLIVLFICFLDVLGTTLLTPAIVFIVRRYTDAAVVVGAMTAAFAAAQFLSAPLLGSLSDVYGRRPVLVGSLLATMAGYLMFGLGGGLWFLVVARVVSGAGGGNISTASAAIADLTPAARRVQAFGYLGATFGLGYVVGPILAASLITVSYSFPAYVAAGLSALAVAATLIFLPETLPPSRRGQHRMSLSTLNPFAPVASLWPSVALRRIWRSQALFIFAFVGVSTILPVYYLDRFDASPSFVTGQYIVAGSATAIAQLRVVGPLCDRFGVGAVATASLLVVALCYPAYWLAGVTGAGWVIYAVSAVSGGASAAVFATLAALLANVARPEDQGKVAGVGASVTSLTTSIAPLALAAAYDQLSWQLPVAAGLALAIASAIGLRALAGSPTAVDPRFATGDARPGP